MSAVNGVLHADPSYPSYPSPPKMALAPCPRYMLNTLQRAKDVKLLTLALVRDKDRILLGMKKRGFGEGYFNGFGGKVDKGETIEEAAIRELHEEAGITARSVEHQGTLTFVFDDQEKPWEVHVFNVPEYEGTPTESDEMAPVWTPVDAIPYSRMWADDRYWYPLFLQGVRFQGLFAFKDTHTLDWFELRQVQELDGPVAALLPPAEQRALIEALQQEQTEQQQDTQLPPRPASIEAA